MFKKNGSVTKYRKILCLKFFVFGLFVVSAANVSALETIYAEADAYIRSGVNAGVNYGDNQNNLFSRLHTNPDESYQSYLRFSLSDLDDAEVVVSAELVLHKTNTTINPATHTQQVWFVDNDDWQENQISWEPDSSANPATVGRPDNDLDELADEQLVSAEVEYRFDVTRHVRAEHSGQKQGVSFRLVGADNGLARYGARSNPNSSKHPKLVVITSPATTTEVNIDADADAWVRSGDHSGENHGQEPNMLSRIFPSNSNENFESFLRFDLSNIQDPVLKANVSLNQVNNIVNPHIQKIFFVGDDTWQESGGQGISWDARPEAQTLTTPLESQVLSGSGSVEFSVTSRVLSELEKGPNEKISFKLAGDTPDADPVAKFTSRDNGSVPANKHPKLVVTIISNYLPSITGTPVTTTPEDGGYVFAPVGADADVGDALTYSITNKPGWANFETATGRLTGTPQNADVGTTMDIVISVQDLAGATASLPPFDLEVTNTNDAPTISGTPATTAPEDSPYSFTPTASDVDVGDSLSFSITDKPSWASFSTTDGTLSGIPVNADVGAYNNIIISVSDGTESVALAPFSVTVTGTNNAPTADAGPDQVANYNDTVFFSGSGSGDPDQDILSYQWSLVSQPGGSVVTLNNPNSIDSHFTPDHTGDYTIELVVNDGAVDSVADEVTISVHGLPLDMAAAGFIDVTTYSGVDKHGGSLSTNGIKAAIADGISQRKAIFFPSGTYLVNETLECMQPAASDPDDDHTKHHPGCVLIGSTQGTRPVIKLDTNASGFGDASDPAATPPSIKPVVHFWREQVGGGGTAEDEDGSRNYNQIIRNIDIDLNHNAGAVGIRHWAAEGSAIQEVYIDAEDAFAGVYNYPTSGGTVVNLHVFKGEYGIYSTKARGGAAVFAGLRLVDQVVEPIRYDGSNYPLTIVGFEIRRESGPIFNLARQGNSAMDHLALIDGTLKLKNNPTGTILSNKNRTIYMKNVFVKGASTIVNNANEGASLAVPAGGYTPNGWAHLDEYIYVAVQDSALDVDAVLDGVPVVGQGTIKEAWNLLPEDPPSDFELQHSYPAAMCSFENPFAVNVKDFVDPSDPDDTEAFGRAIAASDTVLLPVGNYLVSGTIELNPQTRLCGVGNTLSVIEAAPSWSLSSGEAPMIKVDDAPAAAVFLADFQTRTYLTSNRIYNLSWGAGRNSVVRNVLHSHNTPDSFYPNNVEFDPDDHTIALSRVRVSGSGGGRWYGHMSGGVAWDCLNSGCRLMLIENTSEPLSFYMYQSQFLKVDGGPMTELSNAYNVTFYGIKSETVKPGSENKHDGGGGVTQIFSSNWPIVMGINGNSSAIQVYGHEGPSQATPGRGLFELSNTSDVTLVNFGRRNGIAEKHPENTWYFIKDFDYQPPTEMGAHRFTGFLRRSPQ